MSQRCAFCRKTRGGAFNYVTYVGAPDGGVSVHVQCVTEFFKVMDGTAEKPVEKPIETHCAQCGVVDDLVQHVAIGKPDQLRVHETWLHADCENDYLKRLKS